MTLNELLLNAQEKVIKLNEVIDADKHSDIANARVLASKAVIDYNDKAKAEAYNRFLAAEKPFLEALKEAYYPCKKLVVKMDDKLGKEVASLEDDEAIVNLIELEKMSPKQLSVNGQYQYWIEKFTKIMTARVVMDVGTEADKERFKKFYKIEKQADECNIGATPTSTTQTVKMLQSIIDGIIFNDNGKGLNTYKIISKDVKYIEYLMCGKGKGKRSISTPRPSTMLRLITIVLNRIVNNADYDVDFDTIKIK